VSAAADGWKGYMVKAGDQHFHGSSPAFVPIVYVSLGDVRVFAQLTSATTISATCIRSVINQIFFDHLIACASIPAAQLAASFLRASEPSSWIANPRRFGWAAISTPNRRLKSLQCRVLSIQRAGDPSDGFWWSCYA